MRYRPNPSAAAPNMFAPAGVAAGLLASLVLLGGCSALAGAKALVGLGPSPSRPAWTSLTLAAAPDANADSALAVDIVLVKDQAMLGTLAAMPASRYFGARDSLQRTFPDALTVVPVEITPGQTIRIEPKAFGRERAWAALAFANYANPGEHRLRLSLDGKAYVLLLNAQEFSASEIKQGVAR